MAKANGNKANLFTGWTDVDLSEKGLQEANHAAVLLKQEGYTFDIAYTSVLKRAIRTLWIVLEWDGPDVDSSGTLMAFK